MLSAMLSLRGSRMGIAHVCDASYCLCARCRVALLPRCRWSRSRTGMWAPLLASQQHPPAATWSAAGWMAAYAGGLQPQEASLSANEMLAGG
jgi:hypothetical protein